MTFLIFKRGTQHFVHGSIYIVETSLKNEPQFNAATLPSIAQLRVGEYAYVGPDWVVIRCTDSRACVDLNDLRTRDWRRSAIKKQNVRNQTR